ncbi:serine/threonine-protein kinase [Dactylosporangium salmoneum]|uniref:non-specific serine/threonine protein kinase n=1 Tax=Dactylosporangium salmoneum TaxID=53361 RepID=A0ABN3GWX8_9ACTN
MDRYRLIEPLGTGGMSVVWRAFDEVLERSVAVKLLAPKLLTDPVSRRRIQAEARAAALLSHPHIAQVYDFGHGPDGAPYVVMELVTGQSLAQAGPLTPAEVVRVGAQLADALAAVHARGLVHRDVKPANVMLTEGGAKLVDFGISAVAGDDSDRAGQILGTPAYLAPERIRGLPTTAATDVYALALLLYKALAGHFPWPEGTTTTGVLEAHQRTRPAPMPPGLVPPGVTRAISLSLAKAPENRPSASDLARILAAAVPQMPSAPRRPEGPVTHALPRRPPHARRSRLTVGGVVAVAAVGGLTMCSPGNAAESPSLEPAAVTAEPSKAAAVDCAVEYSARDEPGGSFTADLRLTATGGEGGWSLTFQLPAGQAIGSIDGATWHQQGGKVLLGGSDLGGLTAGGRFTLVGAGAGSTGDSRSLPSGFALNGAACRSVLLASAAAPAQTQPPTAQPTGSSSAAPSKRSSGERKGKHDKAKKDGNEDD